MTKFQVEKESKMKFFEFWGILRKMKMPSRESILLQNVRDTGPSLFSIENNFVYTAELISEIKISQNM